MRRPAVLRALTLLLLAPPCLASARADRPPPSTRVTLENGFEAVFVPNRAAPLVTSVIVVRAGGAHDPKGLDGVSHMLEHLLFNGTVRRTQEAIGEELRLYGIVSNAQTATGHTAFFTLAAREEAARALDLQADMLFASTLPADTLERERGIVLNEIAKDRSGEQAAMADLSAARLWHPGPLSRPLLGTPETIRAMPREAILDYYRARYVPNAMTGVFMGDFEPREMESLVRRLFGRAAPGSLAPTPPASVSAAALGRLHTLRAPGEARLLWLAAPAPGLDEAGYAPAWVAARLLGEDLARAAGGRVSGGSGRILEAAVMLDPHPGASLLRVEARLGQGLSWDAAIAALRDEIRARAGAPGLGGPESLRRVRLEGRSDLMRLWEKPHYFGLDRAASIAGMGWEFARDFTRILGFVEPQDVRRAARPWADPASWAVLAAGADAPPDGGLDAAAAGSPEPAAPAPSRDSLALVKRWRPPRVGAETAEPQDRRPPSPPARGGAPPTARTRLPNGLTVVLDSSDESRVFAAHVLIKGRAAAEPAGKAGIVELLHRLAAAGTKRRPGAALEAALRGIGGTLKLVDDPQIPYDDVSLSPEYSYIRLEALDEFAPEALGLLREILSEPSLDDAAALSAAREQVLDRARRAASSPRERCRLLLARGIWDEGHPMAAPLFGTEAGIRSITAEDLASFHERYFAPRNMIVAIGSSWRPERILPEIAAALGAWGSRAVPSSPRAAPAPSSPGALPRLEEELDAPQAALALGVLVRAHEASPPALAALAAILSRRMGEELREKRGLSYSLGAEVLPAGDDALLAAQMGTLPDQVEAARDGLRAVIASLAESPPSPREVDEASRSARVRALMRTLSRINRAYARCLQELRPGGEPVPADAEAVTSLAAALAGSEAAGRWVEAVIRPARALSSGRW